MGKYASLARGISSPGCGIHRFPGGVGGSLLPVLAPVWIPAATKDCPWGNLSRTDESEGTDETTPVSGNSEVAVMADELVGTGAAFGSGSEARDGDAKRRDERCSWVIVDV